MINYAEIDSTGKVINIVVATEASISSLPGTFIKSDLISNPDRREASIGGTYNKEKDKFVFPQPYPSWSLNEETLVWESPAGDQPNDGKVYMWNEENNQWEEIIKVNIDL